MHHHRHHHRHHDPCEHHGGGGGLSLPAGGALVVDAGASVGPWLLLRRILMSWLCLVGLEEAVGRAVYLFLASPAPAWRRHCRAAGCCNPCVYRGQYPLGTRAAEKGSYPLGYWLDVCGWGSPLTKAPPPAARHTAPASLAAPAASLAGQCMHITRVAAFLKKRPLSTHLHLWAGAGRHQ